MEERIGLWAQMACIWEVTARKPGNVHRSRDFEDLTYLDFLLSAAAIAPILDDARGRRVGDTVLQGVQAMRRVVRTNTHLGTLLLLAPLAAVPTGSDLPTGVATVLNDLDVADARAVFAAIRLAQPGGLGEVGDQDIAEQPTLPLKQIMALAAERDLVARQYANDFREVLDEGVPALRRGMATHGNLENAIIGTHLELMSHHPDSLISRKRGVAEAEESARRAAAVLAAGWPDTPAGQGAFTELDAWLRAVGHARNPGTTADLVAASLFAALREGIITLPPSVPWSSPKASTRALGVTDDAP